VSEGIQELAFDYVSPFLTYRFPIDLINNKGESQLAFGRSVI